MEGFEDKSNVLWTALKTVSHIRPDFLRADGVEVHTSMKKGSITLYWGKMKKDNPELGREWTKFGIILCSL